MTISTSKIKQQNATIIDNDFIDKYMPSANGEYVKVYIYLLRRGLDVIEDEEIADALDITVKDVQRAVSYWKKVGILDEDVEENSGADKAVPEKKQVDILSLSEDEEFAALLYSTQQYLGKIFTQSEMETMAYLYDELGMSSGLIEYLVEKCVENKKTGLRYIETVAIEWHKKGIRTVDDAKSDSELYASQIGCVMKAFGIKDRAFGQSEIEFIRKWFNEWGFSEEMVADACARTLGATSKPTFKYADSILKRWHDEGAFNKADTERLDKAHTELAKKSAFSNNNVANSHSNAQYDAIMREYDDLLRKEKQQAAERVAEIYERIPRIKELDDKIRSSSVENVRRRLAGQDDGNYAKEIESIKAEKAELLELGGYAPDYMEIRYTCEDCKDTGLVDGKKCHCFIDKENRLKEGKL